MADRIADVARRLHEALDVIDRRGELIARLRDDLEASGRRLSDEVARRRAAESRVHELEAEARQDAVPSHLQPGVAAPEAVRLLVRHAGADLAGAARIGLRALWHRVPEPWRARVWGVRRRLGSA